MSAARDARFALMTDPRLTPKDLACTPSLISTPLCPYQIMVPEVIRVGTFKRSVDQRTLRSAKVPSNMTLSPDSNIHDAHRSEIGLTVGVAYTHWGHLDVPRFFKVKVEGVTGRTFCEFDQSFPVMPYRSGMTRVVARLEQPTASDPERITLWMLCNPNNETGICDGYRLAWEKVFFLPEYRDDKRPYVGNRNISTKKDIIRRALKLAGVGPGAETSVVVRRPPPHFYDPKWTRPAPISQTYKTEPVPVTSPLQEERATVSDPPLPFRSESRLGSRDAANCFKSAPRRIWEDAENLSPAIHRIQQELGREDQPVASQPEKLQSEEAQLSHSRENALRPGTSIGDHRQLLQPDTPAAVLVEVFSRAIAAKQSGSLPDLREINDHLDTVILGHKEYTDRPTLLKLVSERISHEDAVRAVTEWDTLTEDLLPVLRLDITPEEMLSINSAVLWSEVPIEVRMIRPFLVKYVNATRRAKQQRGISQLSNEEEVREAHEAIRECRQCFKTLWGIRGLGWNISPSMQLE